MANAFTLWGELNANTGNFDKAMRESDARLISTQKELSKTEQASIKLGDTSATVARRYEKLNESISAQRERLAQASAAFQNGDISAKKFASVLASVEKQTASLNSRLKDANARVKEIDSTGYTHFQNQIKGATSELSNLAAIFSGNRLSGATSQITSLGNVIAGLTPEAEGARASLGAAAGPIGIAAVAITGLGIAAVGTGKYLFDMAKEASEFEEPFKKMQEVTGLSAETITTLNFAAKEAGVEFSSLQRPLNFFVHNLAEAAKGSDAARAALAKVGVTKNFDNLQGSLNQALETIRQTPKGVEQLNTAMEAFGHRGGAEFINIVEHMGSSLDDFQAKAQKAGLTLSQEDIEAADAFGDAYDKLGLQIKTISAKIATSYMPQVTQAIDAISDAIGRNEAVFHQIGRNIGKLISELGEIVAFVERHPILASIVGRTVASVATFGISEGVVSTGNALTQDDGMVGAAISATKNNAPGLPDDAETASSNQKKVADNIASISDKAAQDKISNELEVQKAQISTGKNAILVIRQTAAAEEAANERQIALIKDRADKQIEALSAEDQASGKANEIRTKAEADIAALSNKTTLEQIKARKTEQDEIDKTIKKLDELQKTQIAAVTGLQARVAADNPIAAAMVKGREAIEKLKQDLKGLPPSFIAAQTAIQQGLNAGDIFGAKLQSQFEAINLRAQAAKFRGDITGTPRQQIQDTLDKQLKVAGGARSEDERAKADRAIVSAAGNLNPDELRPDQRSAVADALERQATRQDKYYEDALKNARDTLSAVQAIKDFTDKQKDQAKKGADVNITVTDGTSEKKVQNATAAGPEDVELHFGLFGTSGGLSSF